jgi:hypothetical protein
LKPKEKEKDFTEVFCVCACNSLRSVLGDAASKAIMSHMRLKGGKAEDLGDVLDEMFGIGANILKRKILKSFYMEIGFEFDEKEGYKFSDYLMEIQEGMIRKRE